MQRTRLRTRTGGGGFTPPTANLAAWFRKGTGITSNAGAVSQWDDQSGNARHLKQATGSAQPALQVDGTILFDGGSDYLKCDAFTLNQPETVYIRFKQITWTLVDIFFSGDGVDSGSLFQASASPGIGLYAGTALGPNNSLAVDTWGSVAAVLNGASSVVQVSGGTTSSGAAGATNPGGFTLGSNGGTPAGFANMQVAEVIVYSVAHDATTRAQILAYMDAR